MANKSKKRSVSSTPAAKTEKSVKPSLSSGRTFSNEFNPDYTFVKQDLKRIAILASTFVVILIALSFILK
jgi:hypothetical protein